MCGRFEVAWKNAGGSRARPRIEEYLGAAPETDRPALLRELILLDVYYRRRAGEAPREEDYQRRFPLLNAGWLAAARESAPAVGAAALVEVLRRCRLLAPAQLADLDRNLPTLPSGARDLAAELLRHGWLTPYQVNEVFEGRAAELVLGSYVLLERLGEGGMGTVFKARHQKFDRVVALKLLRKERLANEGAGRRFLR